MFDRNPAGRHRSPSGLFPHLGLGVNGGAKSGPLLLQRHSDSYFGTWGARGKGGVGWREREGEREIHRFKWFI